MNRNSEYLGHIFPGGTGLGSSSTFPVGLLHALHSFMGEFASQEELAKEAAKMRGIY